MKIVGKDERSTSAPRAPGVRRRTSREHDGGGYALCETPLGFGGIFVVAVFPGCAAKRGDPWALLLNAVGVPRPFTVSSRQARRKRTRLDRSVGGALEERWHSAQFPVPLSPDYSLPLVAKNGFEKRASVLARVENRWKINRDQPGRERDFPESYE